jgi:alpha-L-fucosidase
MFRLILIKMKSFTILFFCLSAVALHAQKSILPPEPLFPVPSAEQLAWHEMELTAFVHFTLNTFTGKEWGYGDEDPAIFNPVDFNAGQWVKTFSEAGFKSLILTCKHHDGFCLWPGKYTEHSVKNSPFRNGQGDVVREVSDACKKYGLKFGVYLSPWDRNHPDYGQPEYIEYYRNQLKELFQNYGPIYEMWFDGANGGDGYYGGKQEHRTIDRQSYYDWPKTLGLVRSMQPDVIFFSDAGPGVRWIGNEQGKAGETNWNTLTPDTLYAGKSGIETLLNVGAADGTHWIPGEADVSIRKGWFWREEEDSLVKTPEMLFNIYLSSVGRGSTLLLNVPPDKTGLLHKNDVNSLKGFRKLLDKTFKNNLASGKKVSADNWRGHAGEFAPAKLTDNDKTSYWATDDAVLTSDIVIDLEKSREVKYVLLQEYIPLGQRVKSFEIEVWKNQQWEKVIQGTTIGYKRILRLEPVKTDRIRIRIKDSKACPVLSNVEIY